MDMNFFLEFDIIVCILAIHVTSLNVYDSYQNFFSCLIFVLEMVSERNAF